MGDTITWISGLVLMLSPFMNWYSGSGLGVSLSVTGWHTGVLGKLVFFLGLAVVVLVGARTRGFDLPGSIPESLVVLVLGAVATVFVLIRMRTNTVATAPSTSTTRLSGIEPGRSNPRVRAPTSTTTASPRKKTSLPRTPVCQPVTESETPSPEPEYQFMNGESMSTSPEIQ